MTRRACCGNCNFYKFTRLSADLPDYYRKAGGKTGIGICRCEPPMPDFPAVRENDWCGRHASPSDLTDGGQYAGEDVPEQVINFLNEHGLRHVGLNLSRNSFRCMLMAVPEGTDCTAAGLLRTGHEWSRSVPATSWIVRHCGPGNYVLRFTWDEDRSKGLSQDVPISVS